MALTMEDLYSDPTDLFVAGMAAGGSGVAVFSFCRYQPFYRFSREFWYKWYDHKGNVVNATKSMPKSLRIHPSVFLKRCLRLLVHELGHLFLIGHCILCECCMNGSGHLEEDFRQPMHLCPCDLKKLCYRFGSRFMPYRRYQRLHSFYKSHGCKEEASWIEARIKKVKKDNPKLLID